MHIDKKLECAEIQKKSRVCRKMFAAVRKIQRVCRKKAYPFVRFVDSVKMD